jgi:hypothetical protein
LCAIGAQAGLFHAGSHNLKTVLTITDYESFQSFSLDSEWLLSILFDASRFPTQRPPSDGLFLFARNLCNTSLTLKKGKLAGWR